MSEKDNLQDADGNELENAVAQENTQNSDDLINEIDSSNAEDAEDEGVNERHNIEDKDYDSLSIDELVLILEDLVKNYKIQAIKKHVQDIKTAFDSKFNDLLEEKKEEFLANGGNVIDFHYSTPLKKSFGSEATIKVKLTY